MSRPTDDSLINLLVRQEQRYLCPKPNKFLRLLQPLIQRKKFSAREVVESIYLDSDEHSVPFGVSIRFRRYLTKRQRTPVLHHHPAFLEYKKTVGMNKSKYRQTTVLSKAVMLANRKRWGLHGELRPFFAIQYLRHHFLPKTGSGMRITVDWNIRYYYFPFGASRGICIGSEDEYARIEIKKGRPLPYLDAPLTQALLKTRSIPVISKHLLAQRFLHEHLAKRDDHPHHNEVPTKEFEVKFELKRPDERLFGKLAQLFSKPQGVFRRAVRSPVFTESASIRRYHRQQDGLHLIILQGSVIKSVSRTRSRTISVRSRVGTIPIQEYSVQSRFLTLSQAYRMLASPIHAEIDRKKKVFWVENTATGRLYSITVDRSQYQNRTLYQVEAHYAGTTGTPTARPQNSILGDLAALAGLIQQSFPNLYTTTRTKAQWAGLDGLIHEP